MSRLARTVARLHIDQAIDHFLRHHKKRGPLDVGVLGYSRHDRRISFVSLLPGVEHSTDLVPLKELKSHARRQLRIDQLSFDGKVAPAEGLAHAHRILQRWLSKHPNAWPPVVIHCGERHGYRSDHARLSRSLRLMGTPNGAIGLAHQILSPEYKTGFLGEPVTLLSRGLRQVWKHSSPVTLRGENDEPTSGRALAINSDPLPLLRGLLRQVRPLQLRAISARAKMRVLSLPRSTLTPDAMEDAVGCNASHGFAVLSDGASSGVYTREWAQTLTESLLERRPDPTQTIDTAGWLSSCRKRWLRAIHFDTLTTVDRQRAERTGAAGTLLAWQLGTLADGSLAWRAWAVGDSCLFWVRAGQLRATFPLVHSRHFKAVPNLLSSWPQEEEPAPLLGAGLCQPGDLFVLASDAIGRYLLASVERGEEPDWNHLESVPEDEWRERLHDLRAGGRLADDDCTLVLARVQN